MKYWHLEEDRLYHMDEDPYETEEERRRAIADKEFVLVEQDYVTKEWHEVI